MQRDTFVVRRTFLQWLHKRSNPGAIVNLCFLVVLVFSTLLTWREVVVLEDAYISSQRNHLETVATSLDRQLQFSEDKLLFFRQSMRDALQTPLAFDVLRAAVTRFNADRSRPFWQLADAPRDKCAHFREINGIAAAFQYLQKNYIPTALSFL
ncbi:TPA: hypothetical protein ACJJYW_000089 [Enterobacter cloacae]